MRDTILLSERKTHSSCSQNGGWSFILVTLATSFMFCKLI